MHTRPHAVLCSFVCLFYWIVVGVLVLGAAPAQAQLADVIAPTGQYVTDRAGMLTPHERQLLTQKLRAYDDSTSTEIVIVTLPSLEDVPAADYATELGRRWQLGEEGKNNAAVILISEGDREMFIATGYGLEGAIPDAVAARIHRNILRPAFRQGRYYAGLSEAVDALVAAARGEYTADEVPRRSPEGEGVDAATIFILLIIAFFVISSLRRGKRGGGGGSGGRRRRRRSHMPFPIIIGGGGGGWGGSSGGFGGGGFGGGLGGGGGGFGGGGAGGGW